jgi:hypothetical protein
MIQSVVLLRTNRVVIFTAKAKYLVIGTAIFLMEQRVLETNAGKQL